MSIGNEEEGSNVNQTQDRPAARSAGSTATSRLTLLVNPASPSAEAYRSLRASVKFADVQPAIRSVLLADTGKGDPQSVVAANLAAALALGGDRVILVDANLRSPQLHQLFGLSNDAGLGDWLALNEPDRLIPLQSTSIERLQLLAAGSMSKHAQSSAVPVDYLSSDGFARLIEQLNEQAAFVVFDAPPLAQVGDALAVAARVDAVLLLVRAGRTKRAAAQRAKESLDRIGARILGAVLTDTGGRLSFMR